MKVSITITNTDPTDYPDDSRTIGAVTIEVPIGPVAEVLQSRYTFSSISLAKEVIRDLWEKFRQTQPECDSQFIEFLLANDSRFAKSSASVICEVGGV